MKQFFKNQTIANYILAIVPILAMIAMIYSSISSSAQGYKMDSIGWIIALSIISIVLVFAALASANVLKNKSFISDAILFLLVIMLSICLMLIVFERAEVAGLSGVTGGPMELKALNNGITAGIFYVIAVLVTIVCGFMKIAKKNN